MISNVFWPRRLVEMLTFIDLNGDDDIDPDVATKVLEPAAAVPEKIPDEQRHALVHTPEGIRLRIWQGGEKLD
ncbi:hypothetical protein [Streptomyces virginiae]|uniref:hypothetical protein n=1 Tax=Streptomyces virginiae TaxID=1961 RepID=UPI002E2BFE0E|nr:hypothetical protein [Streptomyces virginiae]